MYDSVSHTPTAMNAKGAGNHMTSNDGCLALRTTLVLLASSSTLIAKVVTDPESMKRKPAQPNKRIMPPRLTTAVERRPKTQGATSVWRRRSVGLVIKLWIEHFGVPRGVGERFAKLFRTLTAQHGDKQAVDGDHAEVFLQHRHTIVDDRLQ